MIENSFIFLERVDKKLEKAIWKQGITNWHDFLEAKSIKGLSKHRKLYYDRKILEARKQLYNNNSNYFIDRLPPSETWRLYDFFKEEAVYLDIETDGLNFENDITVIGLFDGINTKVMVKDINLDFNYLKRELQNYKLIVTYNGATFDLPFIKKRYNILPNIPNFDLKTACERVGLNGGLKNIEKKIGINRRKLIEKFRGGDALTLWKMYKATGDKYYLNLLVEYNEEDVINLKPIANYVVEKLKNEYQKS